MSEFSSVILSIFNDCSMRMRLERLQKPTEFSVVIVWVGSRDPEERDLNHDFQASTGAKKSIVTDPDTRALTEMRSSGLGC